MRWESDGAGEAGKGCDEDIGLRIFNKAVLQRFQTVFRLRSFYGLCFFEDKRGLLFEICAPNVYLVQSGMSFRCTLSRFERPSRVERNDIPLYVRLLNQKNETTEHTTPGCPCPRAFFLQQRFERAARR